MNLPRLLAFALGASVAMFCRAQTPAPATAAPTGSAEYLREIQSAFPDSSPELATDPGTIPGHYQFNQLGMGRTLYLFPDGSYASLQIIDIGTRYDQGNWSIQDSVVTLRSDGLVEGTKPGTIITLAAMKDARDPQAGVHLVVGSSWAAFRTPKQRGIAAPDTGALPWNSFSFTKVSIIPPEEIPGLKARLDADYGIYSLDGISSRLKARFGRADRRDDGVWRLSGAAPNDSGYRLQNAPPGKAPTSVTYGGTADTGLAEITISGVKLRARTIDVGPRLGEVNLQGSVEIEGGKLPDTSDIGILIEGKPDPRIEELTRTAVAKATAKDFAGALADFDRAYAIYPESAGTLSNRGYARYLAGDLDGALADLDRALRNDDELSEAYTNRGIVKLKRGDLDGAIADFDRALKMSPGDTDTEEARAEAVRLKAERQ